jgi:hypothetical protein
LNRLSELYVDRTSYTGLDFISTVGQFGDVMPDRLSPHSEVILSRRAYDAFREEAIHGFAVEIAHLV